LKYFRQALKLEPNYSSAQEYLELTLRVVMRKAPALQPGDISEQDEFIHP
jgi:hypothetical protein